MERISIFNYEAFYLDYLDGTLSEADTQMLLQFLEEHPECRLEEDEMVTLDDVAPMTYSGKQNLKQVDEAGPIGLDNVEHFMIADAEGLLDADKQAELSAFVAENQGLETTKNRYKTVYFTPDTSVVFAGKSDLKQRKTLVLWPYLSGAAAAAAVVLFMFLTNYDELDIDGLTITAGDAPTHIEPNVPTTNDSVGGNTVIIPVNQTGSNTSAKRYAKSEVNGGSTVKKLIKTLPKMDRRKLERVQMKAFDNMVLQPVNTSKEYPSNPIEVENPNLDPNNPIITWAPMENPIEPVTAFISEKAKTEVDFKRRKSSKDKKGGFFLKIGNFELSKNKH